jgi:hypothetical protein
LVTREDFLTAVVAPIGNGLEGCHYGSR